MKRRRGSKSDYLVVSDRSGFVFPASEMVTQWDGLLVHTSEVEERNPQEFVRAKRDPEALTDVRPRASAAQYCPLRYTQVSGAVLTDNWPYGSIAAMSYGPNGIIFNPQIAASAADPNGMEIGCTFQVYPD